MKGWREWLACFVVVADADSREILGMTPQVWLLQTHVQVHTFPNTTVEVVHPLLLSSNSSYISKAVSNLTYLNPDRTGDSINLASEQGLYLWPVVALVVFIFLMTITFTWDAVPVGGYIDKKLNLRAERKKGTVGWYWKIFLTHRNSEFGNRAEVAFRGAVVFGLFGLPFFLPHGNVPLIDNLIAHGMYSSFIGQQILFSFQPTVGGTIAASAELIGGTFLAVGTIWVMFGFFPNGVANDMSGHVYLMGILSGASAVLAMLLLNIPLKARIFFLVRFSYYWMDFLNPTIDATAAYSTGFQIKLTGNAVTDLTSTFVGCMLALAAGLFPFPRLAINAAEVECYNAIGMLTEGWNGFYSFMEQKNKREDMMSKMQRELFLLKSSIDQCEVHLTTAWWECFGLGSRQRARVMITTLSHMNREMYIQLLGAVQCCTADDTFAPQHIPIMTGVREAVTHVIRTSGETRIIVAMSISVHDRDARKNHIQGLNHCAGDSAKAINDLTIAFMKTKARLKLPEVHEDLFEEHVFCRSLCQFGREACDLVPSFVAELNGVGTMSATFNGPAFSNVFDTNLIFSRNQLLFATKTAISFALTFLVGYFGCANVIDPYTVVIPKNMALLITAGTGLQHAKNLMRLEGVVLGTAMGLLFVAFLGVCSWWSCFASVVVIVLWIWVNLIGHFSGESHAYRCFLLALFGQLNFLQPCTDSAYAPASEDFKLVFGMVTTIVIMTMVDMLMPTRPASQQAAEHLRLAWSKIQKALGEVFDPDCPLRQHKGETMTLIHQASALGEEASQEPRFWKTPWREQSFETAVDTLKLMHACVRSAHDCMPGGKHDALGDKLFTTVLQLSSMQDIVKLVQNRSAAEVVMLQAFTHDESSKLKVLDIRKEITDEHVHALRRFASDANDVFKRNPISAESNSLQSLESDCACKLAHIVACLDSMRSAMVKLQSTMVVNG